MCVIRAESAAESALSLVWANTRPAQSVLEAMGRHGTSHVDPETIEHFGSCIEQLRAVRPGEGALRAPNAAAGLGSR